MIESLKLPEINLEKLQTIHHINPWWEKQLEKLIKKQERWLIKFSTDPSIYFKQQKFETNEYDQLFRNINNYLNFYNQKINLIIKNKKLFRKFQKMIIDYVSLLGLTHAINLIMEYYLDLNSEEIINKKSHAIKLANELTNKVYQRYKKEVKKYFPQNSTETLQQIYLNEKIIDLDLFNPLLIFNLITKYATKLNQIKELDDENLLNILYLTILSANFINNYTFSSTEFINKVN